MDFTLELDLLKLGYNNIAGVDEVGRGCLCGPVVAACVILDDDNRILGLNDSKKLTKLQREKLFHEIIEKAKSFAISAISAEHLDKINIRNASLLAMKRAIKALAIEADYILVDGRDKVPQLEVKQQAIIKGDQKLPSIAAASILAKVTRDKMLELAGKNYPHYGFEKHVGYATKQHLEALQQNGALEKFHRYSFAPLKFSDKAQKQS